MFPFSKKKKKKKVYIPVDLVLKYSSKGLSEPEIISRLESQGFPSEHIDKALRVALKEKVTTGAKAEIRGVRTVPSQEPPTPRSFERTGAPPGPEPIGEAVRRPMPIGYPPERIKRPARSFPKRQEIKRPKKIEPTTDITVEEIIEAIIEERWIEFEDILHDFERRDLQLQEEIEDLRREVNDIKKSLKEREETMISKLKEFGGSVENIEGRIGSIEGVFKDFLPELNQNIRTMSDLVEKYKEEKEKKDH